jgi:hypothetical protein
LCRLRDTLRLQSSTAPVLSLVSLGLILGGVALMAAAFFLR